MRASMPQPRYCRSRKPRWDSPSAVTLAGRSTSTFVFTGLRCFALDGWNVLGELRFRDIGLDGDTALYAERLRKRDHCLDLAPTSRTVMKLHVLHYRTETGQSIARVLKMAADVHGREAPVNRVLW